MRASLSCSKLLSSEESVFSFLNDFGTIYYISFKEFVL